MVGVAIGGVSNMWRAEWSGLKSVVPAVVREGGEVGELPAADMGKAGGCLSGCSR